MNHIKGYIGIDIGSISTKGVIMDEENHMIASEYIWTEGDPIKATKNIIETFKKTLEEKEIKVDIYGIGTTGSARNLIGTILNANVIKNEITAHAIGTLNTFPDARTILEIGGQDSKLIIIRNGIVVDYAMNTLCSAGTGSFLSSQAKRLGVTIEEIGDIALTSRNPSKIAARCTVFAESDLVHKAQIGHSKEDLIAGICNSVVKNYLNNLAKGKVLEDKIVFQGGVSKNKGVVKAFEDILNKKVHVDKNSHLMGAIGIAIISKNVNKNGNKLEFDFNLQNVEFKTIGTECNGCSNTCEIVKVYKDNELIEKMGGRCEKGNQISNIV
ncbi:MAG: acyl-CoA dehydratase activase [Clostridia bacterium]|nr:acyl-CoA dehydratase activase [Clostridia bacterium]